jgi:hypothetical protein
VLATGALVVAAACPAGPGSAAGELEVSRDGDHWSDDYPGVLIDGDVDLVPGGSASGVVFIRNTTADPAELRIAADHVDVASEGGAHVHLELAISGGGGVVASSRSLDRLRTAPDFGVVERVEARGVRRVDVTLRIDAGAPNTTQARALRFDLIVQLSGASASVPGLGDGGGTSNGPLPSTGTTIAGTVAAAVAVALLGLWLRSAARQRNQT